jgi:hypothetical protein
MEARFENRTTEPTNINHPLSLLWPSSGEFDFHIETMLLQMLQGRNSQLTSPTLYRAAVSYIWNPG